MPEEIDLTEEDDEALEEVWAEIEEENAIREALLSIDAHGREHRGRGPRGGQFVAKKESDDAQGGEIKGEEDTIPAQKGIGYVHLEKHKEAVRKAIEKLKMAPLPTEEEIEAARVGVKKKGANMYRKDLLGNTRNRRDRRNKLLQEFGDGETCPCVYCGVIITHGTMEQDKIYTTLEGGRYRTPNLVPSCGDCNKKRGDMPFIKAIREVIDYVKHRSKTAQ